MKKAILIAELVGAALGVQADTALWSFNGLTDSSGNSLNNTKYYVYVNEGSSADTASVANLLAKGDSSFASGSIGNGTTSQGAASNYTFPLLAKGAGTLTAGKTYTLYGVFFDTLELVSGTSKYLISGGVTQELKDKSILEKIFVSGDKWIFLDSNVSGTWQVYGVPEPTSGLLLVLGVATLALKRRRV